MQRLTVPELGRTAEETVRPRVLPTGDSSAGLPCVGLGRNESGLKKMTKQKKTESEKYPGLGKKDNVYFQRSLSSSGQVVSSYVNCQDVNVFFRTRI